MPNITTKRRDGGTPPLTLDDLRRNPGRLCFLSDLAELRIVQSYDGAKAAVKRGTLPPPYLLPNGRPVWEARAILRSIGAYEPEAA